MTVLQMQRRLCSICEQDWAKTGSDMCSFCSGTKWAFIEIEAAPKKKALWSWWDYTFWGVMVGMVAVVVWKLWI